MRAHTAPGWLLAGAVAVLSWGCGGETDTSSSATTSPTTVATTEEVGSDLSGVRFEVHRDPG